MDAQESPDRRQFRPSVEGLESLRLLSGMAHAVAVHLVALVHAEATKAPAAVAVIDLHGTIHSTIKMAAANLVVIAGSGNLGGVGTASINLHLSKGGSLPLFTLSTKQGKITLAGISSTLSSSPATVTSPTSGTDSGSFAYTVLSGTGAYAHSTGSGTLTETVALSKGDKFTVNFTFS